MADQQNPFAAGSAPGGSIVDLVSTNKGGVQYLGLMAQVLSSIFPRVIGSFTLSAATSTVVAQPQVVASSIVIPFPTNATAALIVRTNGLFHATNTAGATFTMSTQSGSATAGGTFNYIVFNPV